MIRLFDLFFSFFGLIFFSPLLILLWILGYFINGSPLFIQKRVGTKQKIFYLIKFRTMKIGTRSLATHLIKNSAITPFGHFLRSSKLDEVPQLWNVIIGDMSLVGPRPCLINQKKLISERKRRGIYKVKPGITGLAQISGVTMKDPIQLAKMDLIMIKQMNIYNYFYFIYKTIKIIIYK